MSHFSIAEETILSGNTVLKIPKNQLLSFRTSAISDRLELLDLPPKVKLAVALLYERMHPESPWYPHITSLDASFLPLLWKSTFPGSSFHQTITHLKAQLKLHFKDIELFAQQNTDVLPASIKFEEFLECFALGSCLSIFMDEYHENALIPDFYPAPYAESNIELISASVCRLCGLCACLCDMQSDMSTDSIPCLIEEFQECDIEDEEDYVVIKSCRFIRNGSTMVLNHIPELSNVMLLTTFGVMETDNPNNAILISVTEFTGGRFEDRVGFWLNSLPVLRKLNDYFATDDDNGEDWEDVEEEQGNQLMDEISLDDPSILTIDANGRADLQLVSLLGLMFVPDPMHIICKEEECLEWFEKLLIDTAQANACLSFQDQNGNDQPWVGTAIEYLKSFCSEKRRRISNFRHAIVKEEIKLLDKVITT